MEKNNLNDETLKHIHSQLKRLESSIIYYCKECYIKAGKVAGNIYIYITLKVQQLPTSAKILK